MLRESMLVSLALLTSGVAEAKKSKSYNPKTIIKSEVQLFIASEAACGACKTRGVITVVRNKDNIIRAVDHIGGPFEYNTTPAYAVKAKSQTKFFNSRGEPLPK